MGQEWDQGRKYISGKTWKQTHNNLKLTGHSKGSPERGVHSDTGLSEKKRNISNKQSNHKPTRTGGTTTQATQSK